MPPPTNVVSAADVEIGLLIDATHKQKRASRTRVFKRDLPASWSRFFLNLISLALVCSDIPRSGLGYKYMSQLYPPIDPDTFNFFGTPWNYSIVEIPKADAANVTARVWSYKLDSTSYSWRSFAEHFNLSTFPDCLLYREECPGLRLSGETVFAMIDSLVSAVAGTEVVSTRSRGELEPIAVAVRSDGFYRDRIHNFLLPELFLSHNWRSNQALYYSNDLLATIVDRPREICFSRGTRPNFCSDQWIDFRRSCPDSDEVCKAVGLIYVHTMERVREVQQRFQNLTVDLTFLESNEDLQSVRGGLSTVAVRRSDVAAVIRARECSSATDCETIWLSDYRYETGSMLTDAHQWYCTTSVLRSVGQFYFYLRVIGLLLSCYYVQAHKSSRVETLSLRARLRQTFHLFAKAPTQCVVYGSPFPIFCYAFAHLIDAPVSYNILENRFISQNGVFDLNVRQFIQLAVIQMRNVWLYAIFLHVLMQTGVTRRWIGWYRVQGVFGVPEFLLSALSSVTITAQFRATHFRSAEIMNVFEVATSQRQSLPTIKYQENVIHRGSGNTTLGGITIDLKYFICEVGLIAGALIAAALLLHALRRFVSPKMPLPSEVLQTHTPVPYSAGILWPSTSLCVHWTYDYFSVRPENADRTRTSSGLALVAPRFRSAGDLKSKAVQRKMKEFMHSTKYPATRMDYTTFRYIQFQMETLHDRRSDVEGNIAFMNLVLLSDPIVFFYLRIAGGRVRQLGYYQSTRYPDHITLLPREIVVEDNEHAVDLKLLRPVAAKDLSWSELVQCG